MTEKCPLHCNHTSLFFILKRQIAADENYVFKTIEKTLSIQQYLAEEQNDTYSINLAELIQTTCFYLCAYVCMHALAFGATPDSFIMQ